MRDTANAVWVWRQRRVDPDEGGDHTLPQGQKPQAHPDNLMGLGHYRSSSGTSG